MNLEIFCMIIASFCFVLTGFICIYYGLTNYWNEKGIQAVQNRIDNQPLKELRIRICMGILFFSIALIIFGRVITLLGVTI